LEQENKEFREKHWQLENIIEKGVFPKTQYCPTQPTQT